MCKSCIYRKYIYCFLHWVTLLNIILWFLKRSRYLWGLFIHCFCWILISSRPYKFSSNVSVGIFKVRVFTEFTLHRLDPSLTFNSNNYSKRTYDHTQNNTHTHTRTCTCINVNTLHRCQPPAVRAAWGCLRMLSRKATPVRHPLTIYKGVLWWRLNPPYTITY